MIFLLSHYYAINPREFCVVLEGNYSADEMIEITSAITFLFEDLNPGGESLNMKILKKILVEYYGCMDIKNKITRLCLRNLVLPINTVCEKTSFQTTDFLGSTIGCIIDLYFARECSCGPEKSKDIKEKWLPKEPNRYEDLKQILLLPEAIER